MKLLFADASRMLLLLLLILLLFRGHKASSLPSSSCGNIVGLRSPFVWKSLMPYVQNIELDCRENRTIIMSPELSSYKVLYVLEINYNEQFLRVVDRKVSTSSCPVQFVQGDFQSYFWNLSLNLNSIPVAFVHCVSRVNSVRYVKASFCGNQNNMFANSSLLYSYVVVVGLHEPILDILEESCTIDRMSWMSSSIRDNSSLTSILDGLAYGFKLEWHTTLDVCNTFHSDIECEIRGWLNIIRSFAILIIVGFKALGFVIGFPLLLLLVVYKWWNRHLCMDEHIEDFLRDQNHLTPIKYRYSEVKKMTKNFSMRLGEGAYGIVYKGKIRSGTYVAVKMMKQFMTSENEFINEFSTLGHIHHCNIVQLIGFCMEGTKCGLVYEFLPNGSLDRYIFSQQSLGNSALEYKKLCEIAVGVAHGINYLHHGCQRQILHFDIKPHNILLDDKVNPKISDFGLAQLYESSDSIINLTSARGTVGYMAPEMFYKNIGSISRKADIYSFGMLIMEMVGRRTNMNPSFEKTSQIYFSSWVYDQVSAKKDLEINDATEEERKMIMRSIIVALWCIQMRPCNRPPMNKVVEMLEGDFELPMPPKPFFAPRESVEDQKITRTYSVDYVVELSNN